MKKILVLAAAGILLMASPVMAADEAEGATGPAASGWGLDNPGAAFLGAAIGAGLAVMGGAAGIGRIGGAGAESMARQPEAAGSINGVALITAAMVEGATLFAVVVCLLGMIWGKAL